MWSRNTSQPFPEWLVAWMFFLKCRKSFHHSWMCFIQVNFHCFSSNRNKPRWSIIFFTCSISDVSQSLEISRYEILEEFCKKNSNHQNPEPAGKSFQENLILRAECTQWLSKSYQPASNCKTKSMWLKYKYNQLCRTLIIIKAQRSYEGDEAPVSFMSSFQWHWWTRHFSSRSHDASNWDGTRCVFDPANEPKQQSQFSHMWTSKRNAVTTDWTVRDTFTWSD